MAGTSPAMTVAPWCHSGAVYPHYCKAKFALDNSGIRYEMSVLVRCVAKPAFTRTLLLYDIINKTFTGSVHMVAKSHVDMAMYIQILEVKDEDIPEQLKPA